MNCANSSDTFRIADKTFHQVSVILFIACVGLRVLCFVLDRVGLIITGGNVDLAKLPFD